MTPEGEVQAAWASAVVALKRYRRVLAAAYQLIEDQDTPVAREAHANAVYADLALTALRASNGDEAAREMIRTLAGGWRP